MVRAEFDDEARMTGAAPDEVERSYLSDIPAGRFCEPADVGALVAFLATDAAAYITGQSVLVNGGAIVR